MDSSAAAGSFDGAGVSGSIFIGGGSLDGVIWVCRMAGFPDPDRESVREYGAFGWKLNPGVFAADPRINYAHIAVGKCPDPSKSFFSSYNPKNILKECQAARSPDTEARYNKGTAGSFSNVWVHCTAVGDPDDDTDLTVSISELWETGPGEAEFKVTFNKEAFVNHWMLEGALTVTNGELVSIDRIRASNIWWQGTVRMTGGPVTVALSCDDLVDEDAMPEVTCVEPSQETMNNVAITLSVADVPEYHCAGENGGLFSFNLFISEEIEGLTGERMANMFEVNAADRGINFEPAEVMSATRIDEDSNMGWEVTVLHNGGVCLGACRFPRETILIHHAGAVCSSRRAICADDGRTVEEDLIVAVPSPTREQYCETCLPESTFCELLD